jgi:cytoskeletal protein RodZ
MKRLLLGLIVLPFLASPLIAKETNTATGTARIETRVQNTEARRAQFKQRVATVKDEKKRQILEHLDIQMNALNTRATAAMTNHLERIQALLNKIKERVPTVDTAAAQAKIDTAKAAVETQAGKVYTIEFTGENAIRAGASEAKTKFRQDLKTVRDLVQAARQAVVDVLQAAKTK